MSEPIKTGDLVQIVRPTRCGCGKSIGLIFQVSAVESHSSYCDTCKAQLGTEIVALGLHHYGMPLWRLKRIPPLSELEGEKRDEEITA
jgi:hypothetical protein